MASPRPFTLEEIRRRLPLLEAIGRDLVRGWADAMDLSRRLEATENPRTPDTARPERAEELSEELERRVAQVRGYLEEIAELGGEVEEYRRAVVSFPMVRESRLVRATWRAGEVDIFWWHEAHESFAQRQRLVAGGENTCVSEGIET